MALGRYLAWGAVALSAVLGTASFYTDEIKTTLKAERIEWCYKMDLKRMKSREGYSMVFLVPKHYYPEEIKSRMKGLEKERADGVETLVITCDSGKERKAAKKVVKDVFGLDTVPKEQEEFDLDQFSLYLPQFFVIKNGKNIGQGTHYTDGEISFFPDKPYTLRPGEEWIDMRFVYGCRRGTVADARNCVEYGINETREMGVSESRMSIYDSIAVRLEDISNCLEAAGETSEGGEDTVTFGNILHCIFVERRNPGEAPVDLEDVLLHPQAAIHHSKTSVGWEQKPVFSEEGEIVGFEDREHLKRRKSQ